ncbi:hypothetical protein SteCoe_35260 [Stentor coeruleus]|uniref:Uncharacterized protein n=1 Tax=Stentor coeruleus TaxID=5963 RepID=A0A1R2ASN0_9CILI|nr:hypothetical protein SteCoe_35260 [Stentor coeruleus]
MSQGIVLIAVSQTSDNPAPSETYQNINNLVDINRDRFSGQICLAFSPKNECIDCASILDQKINIQNFVMISNFFSDSARAEYHDFVRNNNISSITLQQQLLANNMTELIKVMDFDSKEGTLILIMDDAWFDMFRNMCSPPRVFGNVSISIFGQHGDIEDLEDINVETEDLVRAVQECYTKDLKLDNFGDRKLAAETVKKVFEEIPELAENIQEEVEKIVETQLATKRISSNISTFDIDTIEKNVKTLKETALKIGKVLNYAEDMMNTYQEPPKEQIQGESKIIIDKFFYEEDIKQWKIRISNDTKIDFHNVYIVIVEEKKIICKFELVQNSCKMWKETGLKYDEKLYNKHLIAISQNVIISNDPFLIAPYKLNYNQEPYVEENENGINATYYLVLKNYSKKVLEKICLTSPDYIIPYEFEYPNISYKQETTLQATFVFDFTNKKDMAEKYKIFAYSENEKVSSDLWLWVENGAATGNNS